MRTHSLSHTRAYKSWYHMLRRCYDPDNRGWPYYGGRGIRVSDSWLAFENFYNDMGERPAGLSLERIDVSRGYSVFNCKWATAKEQANNRRLRDQAGEKSSGAKLKDLHVLEIRRRLNSGESPYKIAKDFPVKPSTIYAIKDGKTWSKNEQPN